MDELLRLLALVKREVGADDARAELGGRDPATDDERIIWAKMGERWRVVAIFDSPPRDREAKTVRLRALLAPFTSPERIGRALGTLEHGALEGSAFEGSALGHSAIELDGELDRLAERTGARAAIVFDEGSPVLWGSSTPRTAGWDVETMEIAHRLADEARRVGLDPALWLAQGAPSPAALLEAGVDDAVGQRFGERFGRLGDLAPDRSRDDWHEALRVASGISEARALCEGGRAPERVAEHDADWGVFGKAFARIYMLALIFDGPFSELHAEAPLVRVLPLIESLVLALPPVEPPTRSAKVIAFRRS